MMNKPIGVFVNQTNPPIGPPPRLDNQGMWNSDGSDPSWDLLVAPFTSCVSYVKDLTPLAFGDEASWQL
ncbi:hypothetical protein WJX75_000904 [Coccomyxa subellipsoidea]|uniref:Uncharacterized protein n=1 Tax=Coccomyxa subellipsoidea TaxID=248742 RepID=A0ABR2Z1M5_9CHLO